MKRPVQIASVRTSFEGFGGSGNAAVDMLRFVPDMSAVMAEKARQVRAALDFSKRIPRIIAVADYMPGTEVVGTLVCWRRIPDASGYVLTRRDAFSGQERRVELTNDQARASTDVVRGYVDRWVLGFYDSIPSEQVYAYVDGPLVRDSYFVYRVSAYQVRRGPRDPVLDVSTVPLALGEAQRTVLHERMAGSKRSPYPALSNILYGKDDYDWVLAGTNVRSSIVRGDTLSNTRKFSYLDAELDFITGQMDAGLFVVPRNIADTVTRVNGSVSEYGVSQMITNILSETGVLYRFEGNDPRNDGQFDSFSPEGAEISGILAATFAAIDPETATMNLDGFSANFAGFVSKRLGGTARLELDLRNPRALQERSRYADLVTFDGLSKFMHAIRAIAELVESKAVG